VIRNLLRYSLRLPKIIIIEHGLTEFDSLTHMKKWVVTGLFLSAFKLLNVSRIVSIVSRNDNILVGKFYSEALSRFTVRRFGYLM